jgi:hypothetical protein
MWYSRRGFTGDEEAHGVTIESKKATLVPGGAAPPAQNSKNTLVTKGQDTKPRNRLLAELGLSAILPNTTTAQMFVKATVGELDLTESVGVMREKASAVHSGNLAGLEETLTAQAVALDAIFNEMARRAALNMGEYINATETYLRLGLKAQAMPSNAANVVRDEEPSAGRVREASQHRQRATAGEQWRRDSTFPARGNFGESVKRTIGAEP